ncbi:helix-turn-helix domain-containing protein [Pseudoduganella ginsengisoli]|uniref:Helix-turn-helix domain-containing protein n=1 Tax=Pseudoduganella ginsengisoli TaxID=1462440 RepID=A0A6L6Q6J7_9BURK|nr:helix-turn-helix domain-containing protein [Pseudoduganella ginsengisoli]MTW04868.1 helix-turn-helix domain-containing protein [Pseudoduganella ginsengisoli]
MDTGHAPISHSAHVFRTVLTHDADELARNLTDWEQCYDQMTAGAFHGALSELRLPRMQVFREEISQSVRQTCRVWPDALWFGFPAQGHGIRINGRPLDDGAVMVRPGGSEFELLTPSSHAIYGMVVCRGMLAQAALRSACAIDWDRMQKAEVLRVDPEARMACMEAVASALALGGSHEGSGGTLPAGTEHHLMAALLGALDCSGIEPEAAQSFQRRQRVVARVRDYIMAHRDQPLTVPDLCAIAHVSRRTLQYCFEDVLGMSPTLYLRRVRLNGVRRQLQDPAARREPIGAVAAAWGFGSFSQFSSDYRKLFGASPSAARM